MAQHGHQDTQQSIGNMSQRLAMPLPFGPKRCLHVAEVRITLWPLAPCEREPDVTADYHRAASPPLGACRLAS
jgi:hypothetical protein